MGVVGEVRLVALDRPRATRSTGRSPSSPTPSCSCSRAGPVAVAGPCTPPWPPRTRVPVAKVAPSDAVGEPSSSRASRSCCSPPSPSPPRSWPPSGSSGSVLFGHPTAAGDGHPSRPGRVPSDVAASCSGRARACAAPASPRASRPGAVALAPFLGRAALRGQPARPLAVCGGGAAGRGHRARRYGGARAPREPRGTRGGAADGMKEGGVMRGTVGLAWRCRGRGRRRSARRRTRRWRDEGAGAGARVREDDGRPRSRRVRRRSWRTRRCSSGARGATARQGRRWRRTGSRFYERRRRRSPGSPETVEVLDSGTLAISAGPGEAAGRDEQRARSTRSGGARRTGSLARGLRQGLPVEGLARDVEGERS